ncbi:hypothetical protein Q3A66_08035 [Hymenobacter sp. BT770]|uniref:hypothetical protein n=1 Tax=Hymenobacter sp. BT770 TaxID=2886942 RepID=UPI001D1190A4|nr:hypothetical protein [Hymenobacter sp. BT770]MCC3153070.1 hypothetical protein [Hymenobacter sp. BT770]MDO3415017.1 hypothetical protein [Hymenobacter sp. BT770]
MKKNRFFPALIGAARVTGLAAWQTGRVFRQLAARALDSVQDVLRAEVEKGNLKLVADFLADKALPATRALLVEQMTVRLLMRLGLRGALASNVVGWVLPFVIERLIIAGNKSGLFDKLKANATVSESLAKLDELRRATWKMLVPDPGTSAEVVDENEDLLTPRLPLLLAAPAAKPKYPKAPVAPKTAKSK